MHGLKVKTGVIWVSPLAMADWKDVLDRLLKEVQDSWNITWTDASMGVDPPKGNVSRLSDCCKLHGTRRTRHAKSSWKICCPMPSMRWQRTKQISETPCETGSRHFSCRAGTHWIKSWIGWWKMVEVWLWNCLELLTKPWYSDVQWLMQDKTFCFSRRTEGDSWRPFFWGLSHLQSKT